MMQHALKYASEGFAVFPVWEPISVGICSCPQGAAEFMPNGDKHSIGKHPRTPNGLNAATTDVETIKEWWTKWPNASVGIATGKKSGVSVVDLDGTVGIASGKRLGLLSSVVALTGNGEQLFYADPNGLLGSSVKKLAAGVDTRGNGGYVVAPPSLHPNGKRYAWRMAPLSRTALTILPSLLTAQSQPQSGSTSTVRKPEGWMAEAIEALHRGHVHNNLISVLGKFRTHNFSEEDTFKLLQPHALVDGKPFEGLRDKIAEIWKRYPPAPSAQGLSRSEDIDTFLTDIKEVDWICKPYIAKKSIGFVAGLPETLKTWLCIDLAVESSRDSGLWLGLFPVPTSRVLFIDQERSRDETQRRFNSILGAKGLSRADLRSQLYMKSGTTIRLNLDSSYQAFRAELREMRPSLVIVDSFKAFHTVPENDSTEIQKVIERVKELRNELGCTFVFIHHENKNAYPNGEPQGEPTMGTLSGSTAISAAAEFCLVVRKMEENTSMVWHVKSTQAKKAKPFYASVLDTPGGVAVRGLND
jgi:KaiC/GvpD/RAD55 family RecA-like ATPase